MDVKLISGRMSFIFKETEAGFVVTLSTASLTIWKYITSSFIYGILFTS